MNPEHYREAGSGPGVIMTHGTLMDWTMFDSQIDALAPTNHVVAYNHRAGTERYADEYTLDDLADDCLAVADEHGMDTFVLVGMSMGGFMALELALKHQDRLDGMILIDTMARAYSPEQQVAFGENFNPLDIDGPLPRAFGEWCVPLVFSPQVAAERPPYVEEWLERWDRRPARSVYREFRSWIEKDDLVPRLGEITVPTLVVHGSEDQVLPYADSGIPLADGLPNATLFTVEGAGHTSNCEQPEVVNRAMLEFLAGLDRG